VVFLGVSIREDYHNIVNIGDKGIRQVRDYSFSKLTKHKV
jgi:hypothetical protein